MIYSIVHSFVWILYVCTVNPVPDKPSLLQHSHTLPPRLRSPLRKAGTINSYFLLGGNLFTPKRYDIIWIGLSEYLAHVVRTITFAQVSFLKITLFLHDGKRMSQIQKCHILVSAVKRNHFTPQKIQLHTSNVSKIDLPIMKQPYKYLLIPKTARPQFKNELVNPLQMHGVSWHVLT